MIARILSWFKPSPPPAPVKFRRLCPACGTTPTARSYFCPGCHQAKLKLKTDRKAG